MTFWVAGAVVGTTLVSGYMGAQASKSAAQTQADSADRASQVQWDMFNQTRDDQQPWREAGATALGQLTKGTADGGEFNRNFTLSDFTKDPGYQFRMDQGQQGLERSAAARGGLLNGGTLKALSRYGQDYASGEYNNAYSRFNNDQSTRFNRLSTVAGLGQTANNVTSQLGAQTASSIGNNITSAGAASAAGTVGAANAWTGAMNNGTSMYMLSKLIK
jgi:hypothetical protein